METDEYCCVCIDVLISGSRDKRRKSRIVIDKEVVALLEESFPEKVGSFEDNKVCEECLRCCDDLRRHYEELKKIQGRIQKVLETLKDRVSKNVTAAVTVTKEQESLVGHKYGTRSKRRKRSGNEERSIPVISEDIHGEDILVAEATESVGMEMFSIDDDDGDKTEGDGHEKMTAIESGTRSAEFESDEEIEIKEEIEVEDFDYVSSRSCNDRDQNIQLSIDPEEMETTSTEVQFEEEEMKVEVDGSSVDPNEEEIEIKDEFGSDCESEKEMEFDYDQRMGFIVNPIPSDYSDSAEDLSGDSDYETEKPTIKATIKSILRQNKFKPVVKTVNRWEQTFKRKSGLGQNVCELCVPRRSFNSNVVLSKHYEMDHRNTEKAFLCEYYGCDEKLLTFDLLQLHKKSHHRLAGRAMTGTPVFQRLFCNVCQLSSFFPDELRNHELEYHADMMKFQCTICGVKYSSQHILNAHSYQHSEGRERLRCSLCPKKWNFDYPDTEALESHLIRMHNFPLDYLRSELFKKFRHIKPRTTAETGGEIVCEKCGKVFPNRRKTYYFLKHVCFEEDSNQPYLYQCEVCNQKFPERCKNVIHAITKHETDPDANSTSNPDLLKCALCSKQFVTKLMYKRHINCHNLEPRFRYYCSTCEERFPTEALFAKHKTYRHNPDETDSFPKKRPPRMMNCSDEECGKSYNSLFKLREHERKHHPYLYTFKCTDCESTFSKDEFLQIHLKTHETEGPYLCSLCPKVTYSTGEVLENHLKTSHTVGVGLACPFCEEIFSIRSNLARHQFSRHGVPLPFECPNCDKRYSSQFFLNKHNLNAHGDEEMKKKKAEEDRMQCETCYKWFASKYRLQHHVNIVHKKSKLSVCEVCGKSLNDPASMKFHMKSHKGEKDYPCDFCDKRFVRPDALKMHRYTHTGEKPHECHICDKRFNQRTPLARHLQMHKKNGTWIPKPTSAEQSST